MERKVNLNKEVFEKRQYEQTINTAFTQLVPPQTEVVTPTITVAEFFQNYDTLFFDIPETGVNSHETLIQKSTEYIGYVAQNEEITALTEEITTLRRELLDSRQQLADLTNSNNGITN
jgi:predicted  nucleic acid-binding Zn-ribbon protein